MRFASMWCLNALALVLCIGQAWARVLPHAVLDVSVNDSDSSDDLQGSQTLVNITELSYLDVLPWLSNGSSVDSARLSSQFSNGSFTDGSGFSMLYSNVSGVYNGESKRVMPVQGRMRFMSFRWVEPSVVVISVSSASLRFLYGVRHDMLVQRFHVLQANGRLLPISQSRRGSPSLRDRRDSSCTRPRPHRLGFTTSMARYVFHS
jgi:hypothetical protein